MWLGSALWRHFDQRQVMGEFGAVVSGNIARKTQTAAVC